LLRNIDQGEQEPMFGYHMPTHVYIEPGCLSRLPEAARSLQMNSVVLVTDKGLRSSPWPDQTQEMLAHVGIRCHVFDQVEPNPRTSTVTELADILRQDTEAGVVALGGGSALDCAKAAAMLANNELRIQQYEGKNRYAVPPRPLIAIPTTCGTGSEVTWVAVLSHTPTKSKISIKGDSMFPKQALVDSDLIATLPPKMVAWTGMDALTHALEATTGTVANSVSNALAEKAIALLFRYLPRAYENIEEDGEAREAVMRASTLAGMAFSNADVGAVHCLSESLGGLYDHPHGLLNAILLTPVLRFHRRFIEDRLADLGDMVGAALGTERKVGAATPDRADRFLEFLGDLETSCKIPAFKTLAIPTHDFAEIAERSVQNGSNRSNPQPMSAHSYLEILEEL
jgi:alcohol dehydrogenase